MVEGAGGGGVRGGSSGVVQLQLLAGELAACSRGSIEASGASLPWQELTPQESATIKLALEHASS